MGSSRSLTTLAPLLADRTIGAKNAITVAKSMKKRTNWNGISHDPVPMPKPATILRMKSPIAEGTNSTTAMIGPIFSMAIEKRSSAERAPVRSSELTNTRHRSHMNARRPLNTTTAN